MLHVYYNYDGVGSIARKYRKANNILNRISVANVQDVLENQKGRQIQDIAVIILMWHQTHYTKYK